MFLSLGVILVVGFLGGLVFEKMHLPRLVFYILLGIVLSPSVSGFADETLLSISSYIRQIALVIILTRSGLSLDMNTLKRIGRPAFLMCFLPASLEILGVSIVGPMVLGISISEALLLGSVLAAVSPAVVVPRMIKLQQERYGEKHHVAELIMAGARCEDIYVIVLFYAFKGLVASNNFSLSSLIQIPISIVLGVLLGFIVSILLTSFFKKQQLPVVSCIILMLGSSFLMMGIETLLKPYISMSALLGIMVLGMMMLQVFPTQAKEIQKGYNSLWNCFEILLFT
ncbi:MAG: cation:proton antiporter, partial [Erysipelotrichaceae bacterium]|nr:cation:proton antiporter [Erysipelotrichaceae bacterium]